MADKKLPIEVSVRGTAAYAWLYKPDTKFVKKADDKGKYKLSLVIDKEDIDDLSARIEGGKTEISGTEWLEHLREMHEQAGGDDANSPVKDGDNQLDKKGKPKKKPNEEFFGKWVINFKTGYQPQLVDTAKNDLPDSVKVYSGDVVKVAYRPFAFDEGISLRMNAVMLIDKRSSGGAANAFGEEEGFVADKAGADAFGEEEDSGARSDDGDY